jgi:hypothetical protein
MTNYAKATQYDANKIPKVITSDKELQGTKYYQDTLKIVKELWDGGVIMRGAGFCYSMSDIARIMLIQKGIPCRLAECKITIMSNDPPNLVLIGHDGLLHGGKSNNLGDIDTHIVVVTETEIPMIVDLSISHVRKDVPYIVERLTPGVTEDVLADIQFSGSRWTYHIKESVSIPSIHQQSIVQRIQTDQKVKKDIGWLKILIIAAISISSLNAIRGTYDFYQVYINDTNYWGPAHMKQLIEKVDHLDELIRRPVEERQDIKRPDQTSSDK